LSGVVGDVVLNNDDGNNIDDDDLIDDDDKIFDDEIKSFIDDDKFNIGLFGCCKNGLIEIKHNCRFKISISLIVRHNVDRL